MTYRAFDNVSREQALQIASGVLEPAGFSRIEIWETAAIGGMAACAVTALPPRRGDGEDSEVAHAGWAYYAETPPLTAEQVREAAESLIGLSGGGPHERPEHAH